MKLFFLVAVAPVLGALAGGGGAVMIEVAALAEGSQVGVAVVNQTVVQVCHREHYLVRIRLLFQHFS